MARFSTTAADEVPDRNSDNARRRTKPADCRPYSPARIGAIYRKGKSTPDLGGKGDAAQKNQFSEDQHSRTYNNDVPLTGDRAWLRGGGEGHRPDLDRGKFDLGNKPDRSAAGGRPNKASGQDCHKSPFSAAHRKGAGEGF